MGNGPAPDQPSRLAAGSPHMRLQRYRVGIALAALLAADPAQAGDVLANLSTVPAYTQRTPVEIMAADPAAVAVLNKDLPGLLTDPNYPIFKSMSLKQMQQASGGELSVVDVDKTVADLQTLPPH
jgi:hypothetical protein